MSTGDQTQYIRGKLAQRGVDSGVRFMRDGFDAWAESTAPARVGEMEKEPAEMTNMLGGKMTVQMAKRAMRGRANPFYEEMTEYVPQEQYKMASMGDVDLSIGGSMTGGAVVPQIVQDAINQAKKLIDMWRGVSKWLTDLKTELKYEVIDNADLPQDIRTVGQNFTNVLNAIAGYQATLDAVAQAASIVGMGRRGHKMRGGDLASTIKMVTDAASRIKSIIDWLVRYAPAVKYILSLDAFNKPALDQDVGKEVIGFLQPVFSILGAGRKPLPKVNYSGSANPFYEEMTEYAPEKASLYAMGEMGAGPLAIRDPRVIADPRVIGGRMSMKAGPLAIRDSRVIADPRVIGGRRCGCDYEDECDCRPMRKGRAKPMTAQAMQDAVNKAMAEVKAKTVSPHVAALVEKAKQLEARRASRGKTASGKGGAMCGGAELYYPPARGGAVIGLEPVGGRRKPRRGGEAGIAPDIARRVGGAKKRAPSARGEIVKRVMREQGLSLPQASKYVKNNGLY